MMIINYVELIERLRCPKNDEEYCGMVGCHGLTCHTCGEMNMRDAAIATEKLLGDFIEYVTSGVQNPAPYCVNMRPACCERPGWCTMQSPECRGFFPKGAEDAT